LLGELFASAPLFRSTSLSASGIPGKHLLQLLIEPERSNKARFWRRISVVAAAEDVGRVTVL